MERNESLAANLGAKLTGPRFLRGLERFFDGPIKTNSANPYARPVTWLDVVTFAKSNPNAFLLVNMPDGTRCCQFMYQGLQVEIIEDDWRLISSGALDKLPLEHTFEEDEAAELATLEILEQRASTLYKKADEIASRARMLHHKLGLRRTEISQQRRLHDDDATMSDAGVHASNRPRTNETLSYDIHAELLHQFSMAAMQNQSQQSPSTGYQLQHSATATTTAAASGAVVPVAGHNLLAPPPHLEASPHHQPETTSSALVLASAPAPAPMPRSISTLASIAPSQVMLPGDPATEIYRPLVLQKIDTLHKGEIIHPPCDRCRRLRLQCVKHLTACRGCTKKHARCNWRSITDDEADVLRHEIAILQHEAQMAREATARSMALVSAPQSEANTISRPASGGSNPGPSSPVSYGRLELGPLVSRPAPGPSPGSALILAPPLGRAPVSSSTVPATEFVSAPEPHPRSLPTTRLTRIEPIPTVPRDPPRTGQLASILSPPDYDYDPRPLGAPSGLAWRHDEQDS